MKNITLFLLAVWFSIPGMAQFTMENGHYLPTEDTIRVLFLYAEVDCGPCSTNDDCLNVDGSDWWLPGELPDDIENYIDFELPAGQEPQHPNTRFYFEASFGELVVLGDYYEEILSISCNQMANLYAIQAVIDELNEQFTNNNPAFTTTRNGLTLADFDLLSNEGDRGLPKPQIPNSVIDAIAIVWRNNGKIAGCESGAAFQPSGNFPINDGNNTYGTNIIASYNDCKERRKMFITEYFHALYGGNHWHTGSGAGAHTFSWSNSNISITGQSASLSTGVCGWDRWMMSWSSAYDDPGNNLLIAALDESGTLVDTDLQIPFTGEQVFILRDHTITGDVIRLKLPHFDWQASGDIKNQYLWIENRQHLSGFDVQQFGPEDVPCPDDFEVWSPGIYASVVVGKDIRTSNQSADDLYTSVWPHPNALGSHQFTLSAEGHYDYHYRPDLATQGNTNWCAGNNYLPKETDHPNTLPNPLTGASDLYPTRYLDPASGTFNFFDAGNAELLGGTLVLNLNKHGDSADAFQLAGNNKIGIGTNPASTPVYTWASEFSLNPTPEDFENRVILLNGISVEIIEEIPNPATGGNDLKVKVRWDDYLVGQDKRWCGTIALRDDPNDSWTAQVIIDAGKKITLAQGRTPTYPNGTILPDGTFVYTDPTVMTIESGTKLHMLENSNLTVKEGSTLIIEEDAEVLLENGACIIVEETGTLELKGNDIHLNGEGALLSISGTLKTHDNVDFTFTGTGYTEFFENHNLEMGIGSNFILERVSGTPEHDTKSVHLHDNTTLNIEDRVLSLEGGIVYYDNTAKVRAVNTEVTFREVRFTDLDNPLTSNYNSVGLEGENLVSCTIEDCRFEHFSEGMVLFGNTTTPFLKGNDIIRCKQGVVAHDMDGITFDDNHIKLNYVNGVKLENIDVANFEGNWIEGGGDTGCNFNTVNFAYLHGTQISSFDDYGVLAEATNVFLNDGGAIFNNDTGVRFINNPDANYMLSVGKCDCGKIIDNNVGVQGDNIILDIDVIEHEFECNTGPLPPNRFDGNTTIFDICYSTTTSPYPLMIMMRGNYWGGQAIGTNYSITNGVSCTGNNVLIDASQYATAYGDCGNLSGIISDGPSNFPPGSMDDIECEIQESGTIVEVHEQSRLAFYDFYHENYISAETKYTPVANLNTSIYNDPLCVNKICIANCIVDGIENDQYATPNSAWLHAATRPKPAVKTEIAVYPNPAGEVFTVESEKDKVYYLTVYNVLGKRLDMVKFARKQTIDTRYLQKGVYILEFSDRQGKGVQVDKLIVE